MVSSMTAFARAAFETPTGRYTWEIRSVNHRYAEVFIRMPEEFRAYESPLRAHLAERLNRGKIDCSLKVETNPDVTHLVINESAARGVVEALAHLNEICAAGAAPIASVNPIDLLKWPGVLEATQSDIEQMSRDIRAAFDEALDQLIETRRREGAKLKSMVLERCAGIAVQIAELRKRVPEITLAMRDRYTQRIQDYAHDLDKARVEQECALLVQKLDITEELDRLEAHLEEVQRVLEKGSPAGRRLDFLMQELNREANTIGSKSAHIDSSTASVELKVLIEQMREQIQNIE